MAKVYESDVDAGEFIRSFREESSGLGALKTKPSEDETPVPQEVAQQLRRSVGKATREEEEQFSRRYVRNMEHMRPQQKYTMVEVNPDFIRKIKRILSYEPGPVCSVKAYVNNVLAEHFNEYSEIIKKRL